MLSCTQCSYTTARTFNLNRHITSKHSDSSFTSSSECSINSIHNNSTVNHNNSIVKHNYSIDNHNNSIDSYNNSIVEHSNSIDTEDSKEYKCPKCTKCLYANWYLKKHMETCKGIIDRKSCEYCLKKFKGEKTRFGHYKICKVKLERDSKALVPVDTNSQDQDKPQVQQAHTINNTNNIQTQNNNNTIIDTQNNNTQNIIVVYHPDNIDYMKDHIGEEAIEYIKKLYPQIDRRIMMNYSKKLFERPENQCIKKKNLKMGHSDVHIGNNEWESLTDRSIYPKLACNLANHMSDYLHTKRNQLRKEAFEKVMSFVDYMSDEGYICTDDKSKEQSILKEYQLFVKDLKLIIYNKTKQMKDKCTSQADSSLNS